MNKILQNNTTNTIQYTDFTERIQQPNQTQTSVFIPVYTARDVRHTITPTSEVKVYPKCQVTSQKLIRREFQVGDYRWLVTNLQRTMCTSKVPQSV